MRGQLFYVFQEGHRLTTSRAAFYDAARKLIEQGHDPQALLIMRHAGSDVDCLKQPPLGMAAKLAIEDSDKRGLHVRSYRPRPDKPMA